MAEKGVDYKGKKGSIIMIGNKTKVPGWRGEIFVAVIKYGEGGETLYDVVPDSTEPADIDDLPEVKTFEDRSQAIAHFLKLEQNKKKWK